MLMTQAVNLVGGHMEADGKEAQARRQDTGKH